MVSFSLIFLKLTQKLKAKLTLVSKVNCNVPNFLLCVHDFDYSWDIHCEISKIVEYSSNYSKGQNP